MEAGCFTCKAIDSLWRRLKRVSTSPVSADNGLAAGCGQRDTAGRPADPPQPYMRARNGGKWRERPGQETPGQRRVSGRLSSSEKPA